MFTVDNVVTRTVRKTWHIRVPVFRILYLSYLIHCLHGLELRVVALWPLLLTFTIPFTMPCAECLQHARTFPNEEGSINSKACLQRDPSDGGWTECSVQFA